MGNIQRMNQHMARAPVNLNCHPLYSFLVNGKKRKDNAWLWVWFIRYVMLLLFNKGILASVKFR